MKKSWSLIACFLIGAVLIQQRVMYTGNNGKPLRVTTWDALGYYIYLPAIFIYHDIHELKWFAETDKKYDLSGGNLYQAHLQDNGTYVFGYTGGIAIMEAPFFFAGHIAAGILKYPKDGFSPPYQYALAYGLLLYSIIAVFLVRKILLLFFNDIPTAIAIALTYLATNYIEYSSVESGMSHGYLFFLCTLLLWLTISWHNKPSGIKAAVIGSLLGLVAIARITDAIMLLIPMLWNTQNKQTAREKWKLAATYRNHIWIAVLFGFIGILPQLIYWKIATGSFIYEMGSRWDFLMPHFQVLFGWRKGWFIYTPVTIFFIVGMLFIKRYPFKNVALWYGLLNIYIIIAWHLWTYAASYSARALVESYPVLAFPLTAFIQKAYHGKWKYLCYAVSVYLIVVNIFQVGQYSANILHYEDMNRSYYRHIYLKRKPTPLDMSLLDTDDFLESEKGYYKTTIANLINVSDSILYKKPVNIYAMHSWLRIESTIISANAYWDGHLCVDLKNGDSVKHIAIRLHNAITSADAINKYAFYVEVPSYFQHSQLSVYVNPHKDEVVKWLKITQLIK